MKATVSAGLTALMDDARAGYRKGIVPKKGVFFLRGEKENCACAVGAACLFVTAFSHRGHCYEWARSHYKLGESELTRFIDGFDRVDTPYSDSPEYLAGREFAESYLL